MATKATKSILLLGPLGLLACNAVDVTNPGVLDTDGNPPPVDTDGDPDGEQRRVCSVYPNDAALVEGDTFRWHCSGIARSNMSVDLDLSGIPLPGDTEAFLDAVENHGLDFQHNFGPAYGDSFDDGAIMACCEADYDYPNTPQPDTEDAEHGWACGTDCVDQACRELPRELRDLSDRNGLGVIPVACLVPLSGVPCIREQLRNLANYIASHHGDCVDAFNNQEDPPLSFQVYSVGGTLDLVLWMADNDPNSNAANGWPNLNNLVVEADCSINGPDNDGWLLPDDPESCINANDNNDEDPFESGLGGGFWGADTFVAASGSATLSGPTLMGIEASGSAPLEGSSFTDCENAPCTQVSLAVRSDIASLHDFTLVAPQSLRFSKGGNTLLLTDFRLSNEHPVDVPLTAPVSGSTSDERTIREFSFPTGSITGVASGSLYGVPVSVPLSNNKPIEGVLIESARGARDLELASVDFEFVDAAGNTWALDATFAGWVAHRRAPKTDFDVRRVGDYAYLDGTLSSDGDGDALQFRWWVGDTEVGTLSRLRLPWNENEGKLVTLQVQDPTGRKTWHSGLVHEEPL